MASAIFYLEHTDIFQSQQDSPEVPNWLLENSINFRNIGTENKQVSIRKKISTNICELNPV